MTDKKQIIIDGVDVSKCICCLRICTTTKKPEAICNEYAYCSQTPNCYFKQLASKTKECEELKNNLHIANTNHEAAEKECDRYLKALKEIEEYIKEECSCECTDCLEQGDCHFQDILDIINKAKGNNND